MTAIKLTGVFNENKSIVDKIKKHIATEMQEYKEYMDSDYEDSFQDALYEGRAEYAECLLEQINEWEKS
jgi:butyrate kinase